MWRLIRRSAFALAVLLYTWPAYARVDVTGLETDAAANPLGIESTRPRLSWRLSADRRGVLQTAYQLRAAGSVEALANGQPDLWDTGRVEAATPWADYAGTPLRTRQTVWWQVRVWDEAGDATAWSSPASFELAFVDPDEWTAQWIAGPERGVPGPLDDPLAAVTRLVEGEFCRPVGVPGALGVLGFDRLVDYILGTGGACREPRPAPLLRRAFDLPSQPIRARLYISGLAYARVAINGETLAPHEVLDPGYTHYDRTALYRSYDVTGVLTAGANAIGVELGSGFYDYELVTEWAWNHASWRGEPRMIAELHVELADGSTRVIVSDEQWRVAESATRYDNINIGETYDARFRRPGWSRADFDASDWAAARPVDPPGGRLTAQTHESIQRLESVEPIAVTQPLPGVRIYDMGEQMTGWATVTVDAPAGVAVSMTYGEALSRTGLVGTTSNLHIADQLQTDYYVSDGSDEQRWTPRFSYKGFRYLQVSGPLGTPYLGELVDVRVERVRSGVASIGGFETDDPLLTDIYTLVTRAIPNNLHGIVTDTPTFEKNGWTGDAQLTAPTASLLFDMRRFYAKWLRDIRDAQRDSGEIPVIVPSGGGYGYTGEGWEPAWGATPAWDAALFIIPWELYRRTGDLRYLRDNVDAIRRYLDHWIGQWSAVDSPYLIEAGLGDHVTPATTLPSPLDLVIADAANLTTLVSTAYYAEFARLASRMAGLLGDANAENTYAALHARIRDAFNEVFFDPSCGCYGLVGDDRYLQTANVMPLAFDLVPAARRDAVVASLVADVDARGGNLNTGTVGTRYLLTTLDAAGHGDVALRIATQTDHPSWGEWLALGYTALSESWGESIRSLDHHMFGSIGQWMIEDLAGLKIGETGYAEIRFAPALPDDGPRRVAAWHASPRGLIASRWSRTDAGWRAEISVPPNAIGHVEFPGGAASEVVERGLGAPVPAARAEGVRHLGMAGDRLLFELGSGDYVLETAASRTSPRSTGGEGSGGALGGGMLVLLAAACCFRIRRRGVVVLAGWLAVVSPVWAQAVGDRLCDEHLLEMDDGVRLHAWVSRLPPDRPRPVLFEFESYASHGNGCPTYLPSDYYGDFLDPAIIDRFTLVHVSYRGTGASEGLFDMTGARTQRDLHAALDWAAAGAWSTGDILLTGQSGTAFAAHFGLDHPAVRAAALFTTCADAYRCFKRGGISNNIATVYTAKTEAGVAQSELDRLRLGTALSPDPARRQLAIADALAQTVLRPTVDDWWRERSAFPLLERARVPVLYATEPYDIIHTFDAFQRTPNARLVLGLGHTTAEVIANSAGRHADAVRSIVDRFVAHHGLGDDNGAEQDPRVVLQTEVGGVRPYRGAEALVRYEADWPLPDTRWTRLYLGGRSGSGALSLNDGLLQAERPVAEAADVTPVVSAVHRRGDLRTNSWIIGATIADFRVDEAAALTYTTPELEQAVELSGPITLRLVATAAATDIDWSLLLTDVHPDGGSHWVTDGYLRASLRKVDPARSLTNRDGDIVRPWHGFDMAESVPIGEPVEYLIDFFPTSAIFRAGHRIRLDLLPVAGSDSDPLALGDLGLVRIHRGGEHASSLLLPLIPARCETSLRLNPDMEPLGPCAASWSQATGVGEQVQEKPVSGAGGAGALGLPILIWLSGILALVRRRYG